VTQIRDNAPRRLVRSADPSWRPTPEAELAHLRLCWGRWYQVGFDAEPGAVGGALSGVGRADDRLLAARSARDNPRRLERPIAEAGMERFVSQSPLSDIAHLSCIDYLAEFPG